MVAKKEGAPAPLSSPVSDYRGPHELGALIPRLARPAFRRRSAEAAQIMADWPTIMGTELGAMAEPVKLSSGTLTLACGGPAAMELSLMGPMVMERINAHLGRVAVRKLAFIQRAPRALPAPPPPPPEPVALPEGTTARLGTLPEGELRAALERLAQGVFARGG
jgi:hypothetical protein